MPTTNAFLRILLLLCITCTIQAQVMTPELLWQVKRVSVNGLSKDTKNIIYTATQYDIQTQKKTTTPYALPIKGGKASPIRHIKKHVLDTKTTPDGKYTIKTKNVKIKPVEGSDIHADMPQANVKIYDELNYRHWDTWEDGAYSHVFLVNNETGEEVDLMKDEPHDCPQMPFGGAADYIWNHDYSKVVYVTKKNSGTEYAQSTNTDLYEYDTKTGKTTNLTAENKGYDTHPAYSVKGVLAWLQMDEPGYEADKNDLIISDGKTNVNLTEGWDGTVSSFHWANDGKKIYFTAPVDGGYHVFEVKAGFKNPKHTVKQITKGNFNITGIYGIVGKTMLVTRTDMNHATEIYTLDLHNGKLQQLSQVNNDLYDTIDLSKIEKRYITTTDGKKMLTWVIYPPDFDPQKKYPTLLYCQGGPQAQVSQFYSFRWNFQLMAAKGYIIVAPNRRGLPGFGVEWNEQISGDYGGQNMQDYLAAIDALAKEPFVDNNRLGCVGASYGGYSVFYLAGIHNSRFKTFIAHDGIFNTRSMYGTTEELFFVNKDMGGPYWKEENAQSFEAFNPINKVQHWDTPILIYQGGRDYRVPDGQAFEAFQAAQLLGIKSRLIYFPEENHWVLTPQNGIIWQREFFKWLAETL